MRILRRTARRINGQPTTTGGSRFRRFAILLGWSGGWLLGLVFVVGVFLVGDVLAVVDDARGGAELLVVGVADDVAHVDVLAERRRC